MSTPRKIRIRGRIVARSSGDRKAILAACVQALLDAVQKRRVGPRQEENASAEASADPAPPLPAKEHQEAAAEEMLRRTLDAKDKKALRRATDGSPQDPPPVEEVARARRRLRDVVAKAAKVAGPQIGIGLAIEVLKRALFGNP